MVEAEAEAVEAVEAEVTLIGEEEEEEVVIIVEAEEEAAIDRWVRIFLFLF